MASTGWLALSIERDDQHGSLCTLRAQLLWWRLCSVAQSYQRYTRCSCEHHSTARIGALIHFANSVWSGAVGAAYERTFGPQGRASLIAFGRPYDVDPMRLTGIREFSRPKLVIVQNVPRTGHLTFTSMVLWVIAAGSQERSPPRTRSRSGNEINSQCNQVLYFSGAPDCRTRRPMSVR